MNEAKMIPERKQYSVVMLGDFNPNLFHPEWFCRQSVISREDADFAIDKNAPFPFIVSPQITLFRTPQMTIRIEAKRFEVKAEKEPLILLIDFITKTFENLGANSISAFGYNYSAHYKVESEEAFHKIGDKLAPKEYWDSLLTDEVSGDHRKSGLAMIQMKKFKDNSEDYILFTVQGSSLMQNALLLSCNDHNIISNDEQSADYVMEMISESYENSFKKMEQLQMELLERVRII